MMTVETIAKIRRDYHVQGKGLKTIARQRGLSRNTVRKIIRSGVTELSYGREVQAYPRLGPFIEKLEALLAENAARGRRERLTLMRVWDLLRDAGYAGSYDAVRRYAQQWRRAHGQTDTAYVPLTFAPGEAYQFDWSHEIVVLGGTTQTVKVAHVRLCHSRMRFICAYPRESQEMVFDAHDRAFAFFAGSCTRGIYDNMSTAVDAVYAGKSRKFNRRFEQMCSPYLVEPVACSPGAGWGKGQVENQVNNTRQRCFVPRVHAESFDALNARLLKHCVAEAHRLRHPEMPEKTVYEVFEQERGVLVRSVGPFDGYRVQVASTSKTCLVTFDRNRYSVPSPIACKTVEVQAYADRLVIRYDGEIVAEHPRSFSRDCVVYNPWHYLPILQRKPGALRNGAPFKEWPLPESLGRVRQHFEQLDDGDRQMVKVLNAVLTDSLSVVAQACECALNTGTVTADIILNLVARAQAPKVPAKIEAPPSLKIKQVPTSNCTRYDGRRQAVAHGPA